MNGIFFYGEDNLSSIRLDHVTRTFVGKTHFDTLDVITSDGETSRLFGGEVPRFMKEYKAYLSNINPQGFLQEMVKKPMTTTALEDNYAQEMLTQECIKDRRQK